jgi:hypothetical protein
MRHTLLVASGFESTSGVLNAQRLHRQETSRNNVGPGKCTTLDPCAGAKPGMLPGIWPRGLTTAHRYATARVAHSAPRCFGNLKFAARREPPGPLAFAMSDPGAHPAFLPTDLPSPFSSLLYSHTNLRCALNECGPPGGRAEGRANPRRDMPRLCGKPSSLPDLDRHRQEVHARISMLATLPNVHVWPRHGATRLARADSAKRSGIAQGPQSLRPLLRPPLEVSI